jgi:hypothetical protein
MLSDRLAFDLRETRGSAYSIGASLRPWAGRTRVDVGMGTREPRNLDDARAGIEGGMRAFRAEAFAGGRRAGRQRRARAALMRRMTRISLAYEAGSRSCADAPAGDERRFVDSLRRCPAADVKRVARPTSTRSGCRLAVVR